MNPRRPLQPGRELDVRNCRQNRTWDVRPDSRAGCAILAARLHIQARKLKPPGKGMAGTFNWIPAIRLLNSLVLGLESVVFQVHFIIPIVPPMGTFAFPFRPLINLDFCAGLEKTEHCFLCLLSQDFARLVRFCFYLL